MGLQAVYRWLQEVTGGNRGFKGLQRLRSGYLGLQGIKRGYRVLQRVTSGYKGLQ